MDTFEEKETKEESRVISFWSLDDGSVTGLSDDPLEDLINEYEPNEAEEEYEIDDLEILESSELKLEVPDTDYFYSLQEGGQKDNPSELEDVEEITRKIKYLSHKLKYYNTYLLNRE